VRPGPDRLAAAQQALANLGVTVTDLQPQDTPLAPTFGEYLPIVIAAAGPGASRIYSTYWARMATIWGDRRLDDVYVSDIEAMKNTAAATARPSRHQHWARRCARWRKPTASWSPH
jgi:hypothetical protein